MHIIFTSFKGGWVDFSFSCVLKQHSLVKVEEFVLKGFYS